MPESTTASVPHGTAGGYTYHQCRCGQCREAYRMAQRRYRAQVASQLAADPSEVPHGRVYTYRCGCRCDACKAAKSQTYLRRKEAGRA